MPGIEGLLKNLATAASSPRDWWLARRSIVAHGAIQHVDELAGFSQIVRKLKPRRVIEIGTAQGGVFQLLCRISRPDAILVSVDLPPEDRHSGGLKVAIDLQKLKLPRQTVHSIIGSSHDAHVFEQVKDVLCGGAVDVLFIDGDHTYRGVRQDYEMYRSLVRAGGLIAFHDIIHTSFENCEVDKFWSELTRNSALHTIEIIGRSRSHFGGIGIVTVT